MGWNQGYTIFESTVVGAYDLGRLDKALLTVLMEPYRGTDIDSGGSCDLESKDGKSAMEIVVEVMGGNVPKRPESTFDEEADMEALQDYTDELYGAFFDITRNHFGWD